MSGIKKLITRKKTQSENENVMNIRSNSMPNISQNRDENNGVKENSEPLNADPPASSRINAFSNLRNRIKNFFTKDESHSKRRRYQSVDDTAFQRIAAAVPLEKDLRKLEITIPKVFCSTAPGILSPENAAPPSAVNFDDPKAMEILKKSNYKLEENKEDTPFYNMRKEY